MVNACYSPPEDGAKSLIHAATVPWEKEQRKGKDGKAVALSEDLRYYARGLFCSPMICNLQGVRGKSFMQNVEGTLWGITSLFTSLLDYPLRAMTGGMLFSTTKPVRSSHASYDKKIARELWEASATLAKVPA